MKIEPLQYQIRHFDSNQEAGDWLNRIWPGYEPVSIADTNAYVTVLVRRRFDRYEQRRFWLKVIWQGSISLCLLSQAVINWQHVQIERSIVAVLHDLIKLAGRGL